MFNYKRLFLAIIVGALLGVFCIIGIGSRLGFEGNQLFLFSAWYNRVIMGLLIGLAGGLSFGRASWGIFLRGFILGLLVSLAWFLSTEFRDPIGFMAGIAYGVIIDFIVSRRK